MRLLDHSPLDENPNIVTSVGLNLPWDLFLDLERVGLFPIVVREELEHKVDEEESNRVGVADVVDDRVQDYFSELEFGLREELLLGRSVGETKIYVE